ncbi:MAG: thiamine pyrophosphate-binding protein [Methanosphaera sp.]|nr:thiamine pyrophosphate-binding protein [Methanosphaera sp.]
MKDNINNAQYLVGKLEEEGVKYIFGYPGEQVLPIYEAIRTSNIKHVLMRHEQAAVHAADAYARVTGDYGVCLATAGPGAMNMVMATATAYKDNIPLIIITGDVPTEIKGNDTFQDVDITGVFSPITYKSYDCIKSEKLENSIEEIFSYKYDGISSVFHLNIPKDVQNKPVNISHKVIKSKKVSEPNLNNVEDIIKELDEAKRPLIIAGSGVITSHSEKLLEEFINKNKIPLTTTFPARGVLSEDNPYNLGLIGNRGSSMANYASENADLIIAMATRLSERTTSHIKTDNIIQINTNKEHIKTTKNYNYDIKDLLGKLNQANTKSSNWIKQINQVSEPEIKVEDTENLHPRLVTSMILKHMDNNTTLIMDAGTTPTYLTVDSKLTKPSQILFSGGFGPMGYSIPASIGASLARPDDIIFATTGDGAAQMTLEELAVISTHQLPIIIFIINNNKLGIIKQWQEMNDMQPYMVELDNPDFIELAKAYNISADNITTLEELDTKISKAVKEKKPHLFNIIVEDIPIPLP